MAEGRCEQAWAHTSSILAMIAEVNRDRKKRSRPFRPADFNPYAAESKAASGIPITPANIELLKAFVDLPTGRQAERKGES